MSPIRRTEYGLNSNDPYILIPGVAELLLALWLVVLGVNAQRWKEQASTAGERQ